MRGLQERRLVQRLELGQRVAQHIDTDIGVPQLMNAGQTIPAIAA